MVKRHIKLLNQSVLLTVVLSYQLLSGLIAEYSEVNVMIPCLFKTFFHFECWGCGLSLAAIDFVHLRWLEAAEHHPMIFLVSALMAYSFVRFFSKKYRLKQRFL